MRPFGRIGGSLPGASPPNAMVIAAAGLLIPAPFADWLEREVAKHPYDPQRPDQSGHSLVARRLGVSTRYVSKVLYGNGLGASESGIPTVGKVDRAMTRLGASVAGVYGDLFELAIPEPDWKGGECSCCGEHLRERAPFCGFCELGI